ncbi:MAG TPA: hypothetical protein VKX17_15515 [Planctomycetota bacterium]|nr:hypothetical protein [Planctomycetota bacterium]
MVFKKKARENFLVAKSCCATHTNAAGGRIYYAGFQAVVGELEKLGVEPHKIDRGAASAFEDRGTKWTHSFVKNNASLAQLSARQSSALKVAYELRKTADYEAEEVDPNDVKDLLAPIEDILECLGA